MRLSRKFEQGCVSLKVDRESYADVRRRSLEFEIRDPISLKVASMKGVLRFERKGKLSPKFIESFEILE